MRILLPLLLIIATPHAHADSLRGRINAAISKANEVSKETATLNAEAKSLAEEIRSAESRIACHEGRNRSLSLLQETKDRYFPEQGGIPSQLDSLDILQSEILLDLKNLVSTSRDIASPDVQSLKTLTESLEKDHGGILSKQSKANSATTGFLTAAIEFESLSIPPLEAIKSISERPECPKNPAADTAVSEIQGLLSSLTSLRIFTSEINSKRQQLVNDILITLKLNLVDKFRNAAAVDISALLRELDAIMAGDRLFMEMGRWWIAASELRGQARGEYTKYLKYESSLAVLKEDLNKAKDFSLRIESLSISEQLKNHLRSYLKNCTTSLENTQTSLISGGWKKIHELHNAIVDRRLQSAHLYPSICVSTLKEYKSKSEGVVDNISRYRTLERIYVRSVDACTSLGGAQ